MIVRVTYVNGEQEFIKANYIKVKSSSVVFQQAGQSVERVIIFTTELLKVVIDTGGSYMPIEVLNNSEEDS